MKERDLCEPSFWRGEGLHVLPKLSHHIAVFWPVSAKTELLNSVPCSAETLRFIFPTVWCQTLSDPNEGREKKIKKKWKNKLNHRRYITLSKQSTYLIE